MGGACVFAEEMRTYVHTLHVKSFDIVRIILHFHAEIRTRAKYLIQFSVAVQPVSPFERLGCRGFLYGP